MVWEQCFRYQKDDGVDNGNDDDDGGDARGEQLNVCWPAKK